MGYHHCCAGMRVALFFLAQLCPCLPLGQVHCSFIGTVLTLTPRLRPGPILLFYSILRSDLDKLPVCPVPGIAPFPGCPVLQTAYSTEGSTASLITHTCLVPRGSQWGWIEQTLSLLLCASVKERDKGNCCCWPWPWTSLPVLPHDACQLPACVVIWLY